MSGPLLPLVDQEANEIPGRLARIRRFMVTWPRPLRLLSLGSLLIFMGLWLVGLVANFMPTSTYQASHLEGKLASNCSPGEEVVEGAQDFKPEDFPRAGAYVFRHRMKMRLDVTDLVLHKDAATGLTTFKEPLLGQSEARTESSSQDRDGQPPYKDYLVIWEDEPEPVVIRPTPHHTFTWATYFCSPTTGPLLPDNLEKRFSLTSYYYKPQLEEGPFAPLASPPQGLKLAAAFFFSLPLLWEVAFQEEGEDARRRKDHPGVPGRGMAGKALAKALDRGRPGKPPGDGEPEAALDTLGSEAFSPGPEF